MPLKEPVRTDARARRETLIRVAADCFAQSGYGVALEEIAAQAGVGRGTLYRNFRNREALALAIFASELEKIEQIAAQDLPLRAMLTTLARSLAGATSLFARIAAELVADAQNIAAFDDLAIRMRCLLDPVAQRAVARGELREGITGTELSLVLRMISSLLAPHLPPEKAETQMHAAIDLVLSGLSSRN